MYILPVTGNIDFSNVPVIFESQYTVIKDGDYQDSKIDFPKITHVSYNCRGNIHFWFINGTMVLWKISTAAVSHARWITSRVKQFAILLRTMYLQMN